MSSLLHLLWLYIQILKSCWQKLPRFYTHFHSWSLQLTSVMIGPTKLANKTRAATIVRMNLVNKTSGSKQAKLSHTIFVWTVLGKASAELFNVQWFSQVKLRTVHLLWKVLKWDKMKEQCKVFPVDEKMQILTEVNSHVGTRVDLAAVLGLSVSTVNTIVSL